MKKHVVRDAVNRERQYCPNEGSLSRIHKSGLTMDVSHAAASPSYPHFNTHLK
jgi:hypothetical protein